MESARPRPTQQEVVMRRLTNDVREKSEIREIVDLATNDIRQQTIAFLTENYGPENVDKKLANFDISWKKMIEEYGSELAIALGQYTDDIDFINHEGFIDKDATKEHIQDLKKRRARLKTLLASRGAS